jgi:hypothetical protein
MHMNQDGNRGEGRAVVALAMVVGAFVLATGGCSSPGGGRRPIGAAGSGEDTGGSGGSAAGAGGSDASAGRGGSAGGGAGGQGSGGSAPARDGAVAGDAPTGGSGEVDAGSTAPHDGSTAADVRGGSDAGYGCGKDPAFCDDGVRVQPPTGNATIDALLKLTPEACAKIVSKHSYKMDLDKQDPDNLAGLKADICGLDGAVYWVADMDIDCDGHPTPGKCEKSKDLYFLEDTNVHGPNGALTAAQDPYVVIPIDFACPSDAHFPDYPGLQSGATAAVIFGKKIFYGIFGDCGPPEIIGEASYAMAEKLGIPPSAINGGALGRTVTFIVFTGAGTVAKDITNQAEVQALGESLTRKLLSSN